MRPVTAGAAARRRRPFRAWPLLGAILAVGLGGGQARGQGTVHIVPDSTLEDSLEAGESGVQEPRRRLVRWNEYEGPVFTLRFGAGLLYEFAAYAQDTESREQVTLEPAVKVRDFRFLLKGRFKLRRPVTWTAGIMYDGPSDTWLVRETGVMIAVPELWGHFFVGRTKEGISLNKVMTGYSGWTMERATITDATIPILADGVKWLGYLPSRRIIWNIGLYADWLSEGQSFSTYDHQFVARIGWLPVLTETSRLLHLGVNGRYGVAHNGELRLRSRPEAFPAPYFVDTDAFPASHTAQGSVEAYYRAGPWLLGTEYFLQRAAAPDAGNPVFHGGDLVATWLVTGEARTYNTLGGYFKSVSPTETLFEGGPGALELVLRLSYIDLDAGTLRGGRFWRVTPMVNWHVSDHVRLEFVYGVGRLDRYNLQGVTQFFQSRIQLQL